MNTSFLFDEFCHHKKYLRGVTDPTTTRCREKVEFFIRNKNIQTLGGITHETLISFFINGGMLVNPYILGGGCDIYSLLRILGYGDTKTTAVYLASEKKYLRSQFYEILLRVNYNTEF